MWWCLLAPLASRALLVVLLSPPAVLDLCGGLCSVPCWVSLAFGWVRFWPEVSAARVSGVGWLHYLFSTAITLGTVLMNCPPVFHLQWLGHVPHVRQHLPTTIVWNSPMRELIGSVMVSSLLLPTFGTLSLPLYFWLPSTFLPSKGRSITTLGARWHDFFFFTLFR